MLPVNCGSHSDYQNFVVENLRKFYSDPDSIARSTWDIIDRFWNRDLSFTDEFLKIKYSVFGPKPRTPSCMQRSYLLSIDFKVSSLTDWAAQLKINPLYAILSGFEFGDTPGVGTFYDFLNRLWDFDENHLSPHIRPLNMKVKKPNKKDTKAESVEKIKVEQLLPELEHTSFVIREQPYASLFTLYQKEFLEQSVSKGLINPESLALAGDGTPVVTSRRERKHRVCDCVSKGITDCKCDRYFSQPDCDVGWDSSRDCWYHRYDLYMLVASDSENDAMPYYEYFRQVNITPFIDLNVKRGIRLPYKDDFTIGKDGVPVCREGRRMSHDGSEPSKHRVKFRCPLASRKYGCSCGHPCSSSKYGRTVHGP